MSNEEADVRTSDLYPLGYFNRNNRQHISRKLRHSVMVGVLVLSAGIHSRAETIVVPGNAATTSIPFGSGSLANANFRVQQVYGANLFQNVTGPIVISELRFRPDHWYGKEFSTTISNIQINLSTSTRQPGNLSSVFADNVGADDLIVVQGALSVSSGFVGPTQGPKEFDIVVPLTTSFAYNPAAGNLLVDIRNFQGSSASLVGGQGVPGHEASRVGGGAGASSGITDIGADAITIVFGSGSNLPPTIIRQPVGGTVLIGHDFSFSVQVGGTAPFTFQWLFDGDPIEGATAMSLSLSNLQLTAAGTYSVVVSNEFGTATSSGALLAVNEPSVPSDFDVSRDFSVSSNPGGPWSYGYKTALAGDFLLHSVSQAPAPFRQWCISPNTLPAVLFNPTTNTVITHGGQGTFPPSTVFFLAGDNSPQNFGAIRLTVPAGADGTYRLESAVKTYLTGPISGDTDYHVVKNGVELFGVFIDPSGQSGYTNIIDLASGDTLDFLAGRGADNNLYASGLIIDARLFLEPGSSNPPAFLLQPADKTVTVGNTATFIVQVLGTPPLTHQWLFDGTPIEGAVNASLTLSNVQLTAAGEYSVVVSNAFGSATSDVAVLTVNEPVIPSDFDISRDFSTAANPAGPWSYGYKTALTGDFVLNLVRQSASADGVPLELWGFRPYTLPAVYFNPSSSTAITHGGQGVYPPSTVFFLAGDASPQNFGAIRLTVPLGAEGQYRLVSAVKTYLNGPISGDTDYHVVKNGIELFGEFIAPSGQSGYTNTVSLSAGDTVDFLVGRGQDNNLYGSGLIIDARLSRLTNESNAPTILVQPRDQHVVEGSSVTLFIEASGAMPIRYQWFKGAEALEGATNAVLELANAQLSDSGEFSVVVSNEFGSVTSATAEVEIVLAPTGLKVISVISSNAQQVTLPIEVSANGSENAVSFSLSFDSTKVAFSHVDAGDVLQTSGASILVNSNGVSGGRLGAIIGLPAGQTLPHGTHSLLLVTFEVIPTAATHVASVQFTGQPVAIHVANTSAEGLDAVTTDGTVTIVGATFNGFEADVSPRPSGDDHVSLFDWVQAGRLISGVETTTNEVEFQRLDSAPRESRGNGELTVSDWVQVGRYAVGLDPLTAAGGPTEPEGGSPQFVPQGGPSRTVKLGSATTTPGSSVSLPVSIEGSGTENAISFTIEFDASRVRFTGIIKPATFANSTLLLNTNQVQTGRVGVMFALPPGGSLSTGNSSVFHAMFSAADSTLNQNTVLALTDGVIKREVASTGGATLGSTFVGGTISISTEPQGPTVGILQSGSSAVVHWPAPATGFELFTAPSLGGPWQKVSAAPLELGGQKFVTLPVGSGTHYFRLQRPQ